MEVINKNICLEEFKSRFNGKIPAIKNGDKLPYGFDGYSDYGAFPYNIKLFRNHSNEELLYLINKLCPIRDNFPCSYINKEHILMYKTMVKDFKVIKDLIYGRRYDTSDYEFKKTLRYYMLCNNDGEYIWNEIDSDAWDEILSTDSENEYYDNKMRDEFKKFFYYDNMKMFRFLPNTEIYYYTDVSGNTNYVPSKDYEVKNYTYTNLNGINVTVGDEDDIPYYYEYVNSTDGATRRCLSASSIENAVEWEHKQFDYTENVYKVRVKRNFNIGDVICVSNYFNKFMSIFSNDSDFFYIEDSTNKGVPVEELPEVSKDNFGNYYELTDGRTYTLIPIVDRVRYEYYFIKLLNFLRTECTDERILESAVNPFVEPFINVSLYLEEEFLDEGQLTGLCEEWIPKKKYYIGDVVSYNNECYKLPILTYGEYAASGSGYEFDTMEISEKFYEDCVISENDLSSLVYTENGKYYLIMPYFRGYYDTKTRITYFDGYKIGNNSYPNKMDSNGNYKHWKRSFTGVKDTTDDYFDSTKDPADQQIVTAVLDSKLGNFLRYRKSYDDDGNELPFNFLYTTGDIALKNTELKYRLGYQNTLLYNDVTFTDLLYEVNFYSGSESTAYEFTTSDGRVTLSFPELDKEYLIIDYLSGNKYSYWREISEMTVMPIKYRDYIYLKVTKAVIYEDHDIRKYIYDGYITKWCDFSYAENQPKASNSFVTKDLTDIYIANDIEDAYHSGYCLEGVEKTYEGNRLLSTFTNENHTIIKTTEIPSNAETVEFKYIIRCRLDDDGNVVENTGLNYVDKYYFSIDETTANVKEYTTMGEERWVLYDNSDGSVTATTNTFGVPNYGKIGEAYICNTDSLDGFVSGSTYRCEAVFNYFNLGESTIGTSSQSDVGSSNVTFNGEILKYDDFQSVNGYKDEALMGISNVVRNVGVNIDRGSASAVERHQILGEVNTLEDLENYRNNFFDL